MTKKKKQAKFATTKPQAGKQTLAFTTKVDFMIYGGRVSASLTQ